jgi:Glycosyl hydrolase family 20, domain 2
MSYVLAVLITAASLGAAAGRGAIETQSGTFDPDPHRPVVLADDATATEFEDVGVFLDAVGLELPAIFASQHKPGKPALYIGELNRHESLHHKKVARWLEDVPLPGPEGYRIVISPRVVIVAGTDPAGTFYGLQTLRGIVRDGGLFPCLTLSETPDVSIRGVVAKGPLSLRQIQEMAARRCNLILFPSDDFYRLDAASTERWRDLFALARRYHLEPVPMIQTLSDAGPLLARAPAAAASRLVRERTYLEGTGWRSLSRRNIIQTESLPIRVSVGRLQYKEDRDYEIDPGHLAAPFDSDNAPWMIRRLPGGNIPNRARVDVLYSYVPPGVTACCPAAPEWRDAISGILTQVVGSLDARLVHIGCREPGPWAADTRAAARKMTPEALLANAIATSNAILKGANPRARAVMWADAFIPHDARRDGSAIDMAELPDDVLLHLRSSEEDVAGLVSWAVKTGRSFMCAPPLDAQTVYACCAALGKTPGPGQGILVPMPFGEGPAQTNAFELAVRKAWSVESMRSAWLEGLNTYFDSALWDPSYAEMMPVLIAHLNRVTLAGTSPSDEFERFASHLPRLRARLAEGETETGLVEQAYRDLTQYQILERAYTEKPTDQVLRKLTQLVESHTALDPNPDPERVKTILDTIANSGLFVPSTILFGHFLLPHRDIANPTGLPILEVAATPEYVDRPFKAQAVYDLLDSPGPICRIDFNTVGTAAVAIEKSAKGQRYDPVQGFSSDDAIGVRGPAILKEPFRTRYLRVTAAGQGETTVLRDARVFAFKEPAAAVCPSAEKAPVLDGYFKEESWPREAQIGGFVNPETRAFAEAQTTVRACRTRDTLYFGVYAREARMDTLVARSTGRDENMAEEETFTIALDTGDGHVFRFAVGPEGGRLDSRDGDRSWDGEWEVFAKRFGTGWSAEFAIPFAVLDKVPTRGRGWSLDFERVRHNVRRERSVWAHDGEQALSGMGNLSF